jgi:hypothetical protein
MKNTIQTDDLGLFALYFSAAAAHFQCTKFFFVFLSRSTLARFVCLGFCEVFRFVSEKKATIKKVIRRRGPRAPRTDKDWQSAK